MEINFNPSLNFTSRSQTIRKADDFARKIKSLYPMVSNSKMETLSCVDFNSPPILKLQMRITQLRKAMEYGFKESTEMVDKLRRLIEPIATCAVGNCAESAILASIAAKVNGIKNCHIAGLYDNNLKNIDHAVLLVKDKKPYIIDSWIGFADYLPEATNRYKGEFKYMIDGGKVPDKIKYIPEKCTNIEIYLNNLTESFKLREIKREFQELNFNINPAQSKIQ